AVVCRGGRQGGLCHGERAGGGGPGTVRGRGGGGGPRPRPRPTACGLAGPVSRWVIHWPSQCRWLNSPNPWRAVPGPEKPAIGGLIGAPAEVRPIRLLRLRRGAIDPPAMSVLQAPVSPAS